MTDNPKEKNEREYYRAGKANWDAFRFSMDEVRKAAREWESALHGVHKPWLCWNVDSDWCLVQQRLVKDMGWTPVIGFDPRAGAPELIEGAILIDFNKYFKFPALNMVFPLEFVFLYADRLAFWHSDLLVRPEKLRKLASLFADLNDGETAAVDCRAGFFRRLHGQRGRFWELIGCTTRGASHDQYRRGSSWWRHIECHPECPAGEKERARRLKYPYDHGGGILYWSDHYGGRVIPINQELVEEGHCTGIGRKDYVRFSPQDERRDLSRELSENYDLFEVCNKLELQAYLD